MIHQNPANIYKAQQRGHTESSTCRIYATFNFENYFQDSRKPFGSLQVLNDETLAPQHEIIRNVSSGENVLLIPLTGALQYSIANKSNTIIPGEVAVIPASPEAVVLKNPYNEELINYLYIVLKINWANAVPTLNTVNLDVRNTLHLFLQNKGLHGYMAIFDGRKEAIYKLNNPANGLFVFVINGAFEVQGRLLEERDSLALWDTDEADIEALSENAIILLFEVPLKGFTA